MLNIGTEVARARGHLGGNRNLDALTNGGTRHTSVGPHEHGIEHFHGTQEVVSKAAFALFKLHI